MPVEHASMALRSDCPVLPMEAVPADAVGSGGGMLGISEGISLIMPGELQYGSHRYLIQSNRRLTAQDWRFDKILPATVS